MFKFTSIVNGPAYKYSWGPYHSTIHFSLHSFCNKSPGKLELDCNNISDTSHLESRVLGKRRGDQIKSNYFYTFFRTGILVIQNMNCIWFSRTHFQFQWFIIFVGNWLSWAKWINELLIIKCRKPGPSVSVAIWSPFQWKEGEGRAGVQHCCQVEETLRSFHNNDLRP